MGFFGDFLGFGIKIIEEHLKNGCLFG